MFKKLIVTGAAAGLLLISAGAAFASPHSGVTNNASDVKNTVVTTAYTGSNSVTGSSSHHRSTGGSITTGGATALGVGGNLVNTNVGGGSHGSSVSNTANNVSNTVTTTAYSGSNTVTGGGTISTGDASATGVGINVVNTNVSGF